MCKNSKNQKKNNVKHPCGKMAKSKQYTLRQLRHNHWLVLESNTISYTLILVAKLRTKIYWTGRYSAYAIKPYGHSRESLICLRIGIETRTRQVYVCVCNKLRKCAVSSYLVTSTKFVFEFVLPVQFYLWFLRRFCFYFQHLHTRLCVSVIFGA